jgi:hypothetical protein
MRQIMTDRGKFAFWLLLGLAGVSFLSQVVWEARKPLEFEVGMTIYVTRQGPVSGLWGGLKVLWSGLTGGGGREIGIGLEFIWNGLLRSPLGWLTLGCVAAAALLGAFLLARRKRVPEGTAR